MILKGRNFLLGRRTNIHFKPVFRYLGALYKTYKFVNLIKIRQKL